MRCLKQIISMLALLTSYGIAAGNQTVDSKEVDLFVDDLKSFLTKSINTPEIAASGFYDSFKFNSTTGGLFNRYSGNATYLSLGGDNFVFRDIHTGFSISSLDTNLNTTSVLALDSTQRNHTDIDNTVLNLYADKMIFNLLYVGIFGGFGNSQFHLSSNLNNTGSTASGKAHFRGDNNYIGGRASFIYPYDKFRVFGNLNYAYSSFYQPSYTLFYDAIPNLPVSALTTHFGILTENVRVSYWVNNNFQPFVTAGLLQVVNRHYSHPVQVASTSSALPQLTLSNNGFFLGAGLTYTYNQIRVTPYYQYGQRGNTYHDNLVGLRVAVLGC